MIPLCTFVSSGAIEAAASSRPMINPRDL